MLTSKQEAYCQARARGLSKREAYREAYPNSKKWKDSSVDTAAQKLEKNTQVLPRLKELLNEAAAASLASRTAVIDRLAELNSYAARIAIKNAKQGYIDKDAAKTMIDTSTRLLDVLPDNEDDEDETIRTFDFGMLLGRSFVDLHRDVMAHKHTEYILKGGRGSLKSSFIAEEIIVGVSSIKGRNAVAMKNRTNQLKNSVYAELEKAASRLGIYEEFTWNSTPMVATHNKTGNKILFFGADNRNPEDSAIKGATVKEGYIAYLWIGEASQFPGYKYIRSIKQTVFRGGGSNPTWTFIDYNPPISVNSWINVEAAEPQEGRIVHYSNWEDAPKEWLGDEFVAEAEALKKRNKKAYDHEYGGQCTGTGANVITPELIEIRTITDEERNSLDNISHGVDAGVVHPWVHIRCSYDVDTSILWILNEDTATGHDAHDTQTLQTLEKSLAEFDEEDADLWCDSAAAGMIQYYQQQGLNARKAFKQGVNSPANRVRWFNRCTKIIIDPDTCPMAAKQFPALEYVITPSGDITETLPKVDDDAIDATGYAASIWIKQGL